MKILFVMPKVGAWATHGKHVAPNQLYAHWAAYIREKGYEDVSVLDCKAMEILPDLMTEKVKEINPDIVVLGEQLHSYGGYAVVAHFNAAAKRIKEALPKTKIIFGGLWYSAMPKETLDANPAVDFVVMAEEEAFGDLIEAIDKKKDLSKIMSGKAENVPEGFLNKPKELKEKVEYFITDEKELSKIINKIIAENPNPVSDYKAGKQGVLQFLIGCVMKETQGKADPKVCSAIFLNLL